MGTDTLSPDETPAEGAEGAHAFKFHKIFLGKGGEPDEYRNARCGTARGWVVRHEPRPTAARRRTASCVRIEVTLPSVPWEPCPSLSARHSVDTSTICARVRVDAAYPTSSDNLAYDRLKTLSHRRSCNVHHAARYQHTAGAPAPARPRGRLL